MILDENLKRVIRHIYSQFIAFFNSYFYVCQSFAERSIRQLKKASLKDLRPEDKKRIADLIKELARYVLHSLIEFGICNNLQNEY